MQIIKNGSVYQDKIFKKLDILIEGQKIKQLEENISVEDYPSAHVIDATNKFISPTFIDVHVHFRYPGQSHKEDIATGSASAINGGYTTVVMMPNTNPVIDNQEVLNLVKKEASKSLINLKTYVATTLGQNGSINTPYKNFINDNFVLGFSDDGYGIVNDQVMEQAIKNSHKYNFLIAAHLQDDSHSNKNCVINESKKANELNLVGCSAKVEYSQAQRDIEIINKYPNARYHMCHISTKETLEVAKEAKAQSLNFSCEVSPHHLILSDDDIPGNNGLWKMNPPLRSKADNEALIKGLNSGIIDIIATDHAPHSLEEKSNGFDSPFGIIGLDNCFSSLYTHLVKTNKVKLETIIEAMSVTPSRIYKLKDPTLKIGAEANLNIIDLDKEFILDENFIKSKSKNTPFINKKLFGQISHTFYKGKNLKA